MFMTSSPCIPVTIALGRSVVTSCEGQLIKLRETEFSAVFCVVPDVHNFDSTDALDTEHPTNGTGDKTKATDVRLHNKHSFLQVSPEIRTSHPRCRGQRFTHE
jgi:hypothetical protein